MDRKKTLLLLISLGALFAVNLYKGGEMEYQLAISEFILVIVGATWLFWMAASGEIRFRSSAASLTSFLFLGALFISALLSPNSTSSFRGLHETISYVVIFLLCLNLSRGKGRARAAYILIGVAAIQAAVATVQAAAGTERVGGTLFYPTYLVDTLIVGLSLCAGLIIFSEKRRAIGIVTIWAILLITFCALFLTRARAGLPVLASSLIVLGVMKSRKVLLVLVVVVLAAAVVPNPVRDRILNAGKQDIYALKRPAIWRQAVEIVRMRPSAGVGMRNYAYYSRRTNFPVEEAVGRYSKVAKIAHNEYLQYAATTGLAGLATFLLLMGSFLVGGFRLARSRDPVSVGALAAFVAILVHAFVDNVLYLPLNGYLLFALAGVLLAGAEAERVLKPPPRSKIYVWVLALAYGLMVIRPAISSQFYASGLRKAERGDIRAAIGSCRAALTISPREAVYHNALAKLFAKMYDQTGGVGYMFIAHKRHESAVRSNPIDRVYWEGFADFIYEHRRNIGEEEAYGNAAELLQEAVRADPFNPFLRKKLAVVYVEAGAFDKAITELKKIVALEPNFHSARFMLARVYADLGMDGRAVEQYRILEEKRRQRLELRVQNEYEKNLIAFDWSALPKM